jgi:hypothetical protein
MPRWGSTKLLAACLTALLLTTNLLSPRVAAQAPTQLEPRRRVHAPYFGSSVRWAEAGIMWFGRVDPPGAPGQNYADVRVGYTTDELVLFVNIEDYYIWYDRDATPSSDLTQYDAVAIYLDTAHDRTPAPQTDDYLFLSGLRLYETEATYRREARGTGGGWDFGWQAGWDDSTWPRWWCNPGPNSNECGIDFGWGSQIHIPWSTLGRSGPPAEGTIWGLGVLLYDRDNQPPAGSVPPEHWPETFSSGTPSTWGELAFGQSVYTPPPSTTQGTTVIRRGLGASSVEDAWVGGGGGCTGGHEGDPEHDNYGDDTGLYVANQSLIADFTCFSKSYLRFDLNQIPAGKVIVSASLLLHHWGNAEPDLAGPSLIWLFTVDGSWEEHTLTWNNAPLARENLTATWVDPLPGFPGWPGVPYSWDATEAVAEAYAAGEPLNVALYTADTPMHSSKYFSSSDTGDWNAIGRPTLTVVWGAPLAELSKSVHPITPGQYEELTYSLTALGNGQELIMTDPLPEGLGLVGDPQSTSGSVSYDPNRHQVVWTGTPEEGVLVTVSFSAIVDVTGPRALVNTAVLTDALGNVSTATAMAIVDALRSFLPVTTRRY